MPRILLCSLVVLLTLASALALAGSEGEALRSTEVRPAPGVTAYFHARLVALARRLDARPGAAELLRAGLGTEHDATERSLRLGFVPPSLGRAGVLREGSAREMEADPALVLAIAGALDAKRLRTASRAEIDAELARIDAQIARVNAHLRERHDERAAHYRKRGRIPESLEREAVAVLTGEDTAPGAADASRWESALEDEALVARRIDLITAHMNRASEPRK